MMKTIILLLGFASIAYVIGECPNACSGHGDCEAFDQCNCYRGWMAADCSDKQCDMGYAFTTTPQGDLNVDGDREDNSFKQLSEPGLIRINTNTITFARSGLQKNELKVGDGLKICNEAFIVTQLRGREIKGTGDDSKTNGDEIDDVTHEITSATADDFKRRIKEVVLNTRHTQNCGTPHSTVTIGNTEYTGAIAKGDGATDPVFTKSNGNDFVANTNFVVGERVYIWCTGANSGLFGSTNGALATGNNNYGYLEDGVYRDGGRFLTIKAVASTTTLTFEERIGHDASTCTLIPANHHIVYRHLTTQARPNGDWEKWKGDFKGTNTRAGRGPTMNNMEAATYQRLGVNFADGDSLGLGDYGQDEGHFYMECSNQGLCDRKTGYCECFDGYTGRACQRQSCPEDCSGHGVCLSVDQLRRHDMTKLGITCETKRDNKVVTCDGDLFAAKLRANDYVKIGNFPPMKIAAITATGNNVEYELITTAVAVSTTSTALKITNGQGPTSFVANSMVVKTSTNEVMGKVTAVDAAGTPDTVTLGGGSAVALAVGEKFTIRSPTDNYNTTHFLSGLTPTNDKANKVDEFTLYNAFPESVPYGTEVWQVHAYDLWDADKNMACKCDPRWTGYDCSERKCPLGDDPLTVDAVDGQGTTTTTDDSAYTQSPEKQTLVINSGQTDIGGSAVPPTGMLIGHFTLAFEDYFGETFVTRPIPIEVEMSVSVSAAASGLEVLFDSAEGLPSSELSRGDEIRIGRDIRFVEKITFVDHNTKTHIKSFLVRDAYLGSGTGGENFHTAHASGSRLYRRDVSKEIREALLNIPNARVEGVSVEKLEISGDYVSVNVATYAALATTNGKATAAGTTIEDNWKVGDLIRIRSHVRIVTGTYADTVTFHGTMGADANAFQLPYRAAMQKYRIKFESGCMTDDHCNHNGVNSYDSDAGATCSLGGSCYCSLPSNTGKDQYHGFGCTRKGKGNDFHGTPRAINHARPYKRSNSGDLPLMQCDKDEIFSGKIIDSYASVSKATPTKVKFEANYLQVRDPVQASSTVSATGATGQAVIAVASEDIAAVAAGMTAIRVSDGALVGKVQSIANSGAAGAAVTLAANLAVALAANDEITFGTPMIAVGNEIYIDGQVRTVVETSDTNGWVKVDTPFTIYSKSDDDNIVPSGSTVYQIDRLGGVGLSCQLTDMPRLTDHDATNVAAKGKLETMNEAAQTVDGDDTKSSQTNPHTKVTIRPMDPQEVEIGDRIRVDTDTGAAGLTPGTYITHTVDKIDYETTTVDTSAAAVTVEGGIASFTLNEVISVEDTTTGNMALVADDQTRFVYNDQRGTTENKECSGRGLCDESAGTCACFKGYTDDDCSRQHSLASS